jgi:hypothetical protein
MFIGVIGLTVWCAVGREWKKEIGMDVCKEIKDEIKKWLKSLKSDGTPDPAAAPATPGSTPAGQPAAAPTNIPKSLSQQAAEDNKTGVKADTRLLALIDAKKTHPTTNGTIDHYIAFAQSLKDTPLQTLVAPNNDPKMGIFGDGSLDPIFSNSIPANLDKTLLKDFLRRYLTGQSIRNSALKPAGGSWEDYKTKFDLTKTLGDEIQKTYIQNTPTQSNNTGTTTIDEAAIKAYTVTGATIESTKTTVVKNADWSFSLNYALNPIWTFIPDNPLAISLDKSGTITSPSIKLRGKAWALGTTEKVVTVLKNGSTINLQVA